jgi:shikimate 5-dehydrogenase
LGTDFLMSQRIILEPIEIETKFISEAKQKKGRSVVISGLAHLLNVGHCDIDVWASL